jgi:hypothetical protein
MFFLHDHAQKALNVYKICVIVEILDSLNMTDTVFCNTAPRGLE